MRRFFGRLLCVAGAVIPVLLGNPAPAAPAAAGEVERACAQIRQTSETIRKILEDPALMGKEHADERFARVREALNERFDWPSISHWVLGRNVRKFDEEHFKEFANLFSRYVVLYYMAKVEDYIGNEDGKDPAAEKVKILYEKGRARRDGAVVAKVSFTLPDRKQIDTVYTMVKDRETNEWKVRNFVVEGVSLVSNWRTELNYIGRRDKILSLLRKKVNGLEKQREQGAAKEKKR